MSTGRARYVFLGCGRADAISRAVSPPERGLWLSYTWLIKRSGDVSKY